MTENCNKPCYGQKNNTDCDQCPKFLICIAGK